MIIPQRYYATLRIFASFLRHSTRRDAGCAQIESTIVRYGLKSATDDWLGWVRLLGLRVSASRLATCVLHRLRHADSGFAWHGSFASFSASRTNRIAETVSPARHRPNLKRAVGGKEQARVKGGRRAKHPIIPRSPTLHAGKSRMTK